MQEGVDAEYITARKLQRNPLPLYTLRIITLAIHYSTHFWTGLVILQELIMVQHALSMPCP